MKYEDLINELCFVIKESEVNAQQIYDTAETINEHINKLDILSHQKTQMTDKLVDIFGLLQHQDLHRQKIERVVNYICDKNDIDPTQYNIAPSAKNIESSDDTLNEDELEELIRQMQA